jgi:hypothetical protein
MACLKKLNKTRVSVEATGGRSKGDRNFPKSSDSSYAQEDIVQLIIGFLQRGPLDFF